MRRQSSELFLEGALSPPCQRMGAMVAFQCFDDFKRSLLLSFSCIYLYKGHVGQSVDKSWACFSFFHRNFEEVLLSFAEPLLENFPFSESCSSLYEEENCKVSAAAMKVSLAYQ